MAAILPYVEGGVTIPVGTTTGTVQVTRNTVYTGTDRDTCIIKGDGSLGSAVFQYTSGIVDQITIRNCTIDCSNTSSVLCALSINSNLRMVVLSNVKIVGCYRGGCAIFNGGRLYAENILIIGDGGGIQALETSTQTEVVGCEIRGCKFGIINSDVGPTGVVPGINLVDVEVYHHYWQSPTYESVTISSIQPTYVDVVSHVQANRSYADCLRLLNSIGTYTVGNPLTIGERWDRIEVADGRWSYVLDIINGVRVLDMWHAAGSWTPTTQPTGTATVYSVVIGRLGEFTNNRLNITYGSLWPTAGWRTIPGVRVVTPTATRLDILRHGISVPSVRDVDTGGFHITKPAINAKLDRCFVEGGFSDMITTRGPGSVVTNCTVSTGQDMGFTVDCQYGPQTYIDCVADKPGVGGFAVIGSTGATITNAVVSGAGLHNDGSTSSGFAVATDPGSKHSISVRGYGNRFLTLGGSGIDSVSVASPVQIIRKAG